MSNVSLLHEAPLEVLRRDPLAVLELLRIAGRPERGRRGLTVDLLDSELTEASPSVRRADFVAILRDPNGRARRVVIVEVQRERDDEKLSAWPLYVAYLNAQQRVPTTLVVLTFDDAVAAWARKPRRVGPNMVLAPLAVGPADLPEIASIDDALAHPQMSMLTALARLGARAPREIERHEAEIVRVFEAVLRTADEQARRRYLSLLHGTSKSKLRSTLERLTEAYDMGALEMIRAEGKAEGVAVGRAEGEALALLKVLAARGLQLDATTESRIRRTRNIARLDRWLERAARANTIEEVLADESAGAAKVTRRARAR